MTFDPSALTDAQLEAAQAEQRERRSRELKEAEARRVAALAPLVEAGLAPALVSALEAAEIDPDLRDLLPHIRAALIGVKALVARAGATA